MQTNRNIENAADLLDNIVFNGVEEAPLVSWRAEVRQAVQDIIVPDGVSWMDDDEDMTNESYVNHALGAISDRFAR